MDKRVYFKNVKRTAALAAVLFTVLALFCAGRAFAAGGGSLKVGEDAVVDYSGSNTLIIADYDNCLTDSEKRSLIEEMKKASDKAHCNIGIVITKDLQGFSDKQYADKFSDDNFGLDSPSIVLMLLNTYNEPQYSKYVDRLSTSGRSIINRFQSKINRMFDRIYRKLGDPKGYKYAYNIETHTYGGYNYYAGCKEFVKCVKAYGSTGFSAIVVKFTDYITGSFTKFFMGCGIAVGIGLLIVTSKVRGYRKKRPINANAYMDRSGTRITRQVDQFVREYTTHHTNSSSSGGGHHGGGGGHHGGGGGHHR